MFIDLGRALTTADIINKGVVALAVVCAGIWALFKYVIQENPAAQLAHDQLRRFCAERGSLDIKIDAKNTGSTIIGNVSLKNIGTRRVNLELYHYAPIAITEITFTPDGKPRSSRSIEVSFPIFHREELVDWDRPSVLPGRTMEMHFAASVGQPGIYLISFRGGPRDILPDDGACRTVEKPPETSWFWAATAIQQVSQKNEATRGVLRPKHK